MLEVKGDFCHDVRSILDGAGRGDDYLEIGMGGVWKMEFPSPRGGSIRTRWPTPLPAFSINFSARARSPFGSKPTPI